MKKQVPLIILLTLLAAGAAFVGWAVVSGHLSITQKNPDEVVLVRHEAVCDDAIIETYNAAVNASDYEDYQAAMKAAYDEVSGLEGAEQDPTCVFIEYKYYLSEIDTEGIDKTVAQLTDFINSGNSPSAKLADIESLTSIESRASTYTDTEPTEAGGRG